ncbi:glutaredoxin family protein [Halobacillus litoralis]|uniref:glutaredoxin family protein n=1 Tax=Halobacillus litoralis TaxID=45668 RepID=UPI001CD256DB|nr:glutaredoxin family protein [Halobacillus litoralis]MCA1021488.1 glutaredoxin family protein [Halobacillus litoralis]
MSNIKVYTKNGCPQCDMTKGMLNDEGIEYEVINVEDNVEALSYVKDELGLMSMPVVEKKGEEPFSGFRPDKLLNLK